MKTYMPVFSIDPNGPWKTIDDTLCLITHCDDEDLRADLRSNEIELGTEVFMFQPNEVPGQRYSETGWGTMGRLKDWVEKDDYFLVYLDILPEE